MIKLGVNIDHVATIRQQRRGSFPSPVEAALVAQNAGANSIVAHLREDRRHIQKDDVFALKKQLSIPLTLEMGATPAMIDLALELKPAWVCLVPERREELTTEGGLDARTREKDLSVAIPRFHASNIKVSLFLNPDLDQVGIAKQLKADAVELHTGRYADTSGSERDGEVKALCRAGAAVVAGGLHLHAGHGLNYDNLDPILQIPNMEELNIGFSIISRALFVGLHQAVQEMKQRI